MSSDQDARPSFPFAVAPPLLGTAQPDREARQRRLMETLYGSAADSRSTEVVVKNTFIHVEDVAQPLMRSRSERDLGSSTSSSQSDRRFLNNGYQTSSSASSASSANDNPVGLAHPRARAPSSASDESRGAVRTAAPSDATGCSAAALYTAPQPQPGMASSSSSINARPCSRRVAQIASYLNSGAGVSANLYPDGGYSSCTPAHASGIAASGIFANDRNSSGTDWNAFQHASRSASARGEDNRLGWGASSIALWPSSAGAPRADAENDFPDVDETQEQEQTGEWSNGAVHHDAGDCRPCMYYRSKNGCRNGRSCMFCHLPHGQKPRARPCKAKREHCKQIAEMIGDDFAGDPQHVVDAVCRSDAAIPSNSKESAYLLSILQKKAQRQQEERREQSAVHPFVRSSTHSGSRQQYPRLFKMSL